MYKTTEEVKYQIPLEIYVYNYYSIMQTKWILHGKDEVKTIKDL